MSKERETQVTKIWIAREEFILVRNKYIEVAGKSSDVFDRAIITIGTSLLWTSMYFVNREECIGSKWLLLTSWLLLWVWIWAIVFSFYLSERVNTIRYEERDLKNYGDEKLAAEKSGKCIRINDYLQLIKVIDIILIPLWIVFLAIFFRVNL